MHSFKLLGLALIYSTKSFALSALPDSPPIPKDNPMTVEKINLGKTLYFETRISKNGTLSCNTCHNIMLGGDDMRSVSVGVEGKKGGRSAPTVWNAAFHTVQFWDGRAVSLEEQAVGPITNPIEMGMPHDTLVIDRLSKIDGYVSMFKKAFPNETGPINKTNIGKAIAAFERTLIAGNSPFDQYMKGNKKALSKNAINGMKLVQNIGCTACHSGANFNSENLKMGEGNFQKFPTFVTNDYVKKYKLTDDLGRYDVTKKEEDKNMWRVPTWRNVALTPPYFHNGSVKTLEEAVRVMAKVQLDKDLNENEVNDIVAFLESLTGKFPKMEMPRLPIYTKSSLVETE